MVKEFTKENAKEVLKELSDNTVDIVEAGRATRWKKGESGNPFNRHEPLEGTLDEVLAAILGKEGAKRLARKLVDLALKGDRQAIMYIYDRLEGKPRQSTIIEKPEENPLVIILQRLHEREQLPSSTILQIESSHEDAV